MGYESRIYIVHKTSITDDNINKRWAEVIAMFNMCKMPSIAGFMRVTDCYIYGSDGNTKLLEDTYGDPLTEASVVDVIAVLEKDIANGEDYRRIFPLLATLKALEEHNHQWQDLAVLHYGY